MEDPQQLIALIMGFVPAQAVSVAAELGIPDLLARESMTAEQLAYLTHCDARSLFRLLRFLASIGIFRSDEHDRFSLTPMASLLRSDIEGSIRPIARIMARVGPRTANHLIDAVRSAKNPFEQAFGQHLFAYLSEHQDDAVLFDAAMNGFHGGETHAVLDAYEFDGIRTLADIGCGNGTVLSATLKRYPKLRGLFFDQGYVMERTRSNIQAAGLGDRAEVQSGSFFESVPDGADAYFMRHIIHDWPDDASVQIIRNVRRVIPADGRLLIVETIVPEGNDPSPAKAFDITMMLFPPHGLERTEEEYRKLLGSAGFAVSKITPTKSPVSVIEARPV
jgi:SAM-dependent methyltransferase